MRFGYVSNSDIENKFKNLVKADFQVFVFSSKYRNLLEFSENANHLSQLCRVIDKGSRIQIA